jgi:hypothetical protein
MGKVLKIVISVAVTVGLVFAAIKATKKIKEIYDSKIFDSEEEENLGV